MTSYGGTKTTDFEEADEVTPAFILSGVDPTTGVNYQFTISQMKTDAIPTGVSSDASNALSAGADGKPWLSSASLGGGSGAVTSVNGSTGAVTVTAAGLGAILATIYDANTIVYATTDNTPVALTVGEQTFVGRITGGNIAALTAAQGKTLFEVLAGGAYTGAISFSGTTNSGLRVSNLTTAERDALTGAAGMVIWNTTSTQLERYSGSAWAAVAASTYAGVQAEMDAILLAGGAPAAALAATMTAILGLSGTPLVFAAATDLWTETAGYLQVTPEILKAAEAVVALTVSSNVITMDGSLFWNGRATVTANFTIGAPSSGTTHPRRVWVTASGGDWTATAHANYSPVNFGAGVTIPSGKRGLFIWEVDGGDDLLTFAGLED